MVSPQSRPQTFSKDLKNIELTESPFEIYQVNALYDFSYQRIKLYDYQKLLAQNIRQAILENDDHEYNSVDIVIQFEKITETTFTEKDSPTLKITITLSDISDGITNEYKEVLCAFLLSVARKEGFREEERLRVGATILPLALVSYENKIFLKSFIDFLEENFSCVVNPVNFSTLDLKWCLTLFSSPGGEKRLCSTVLQYETTIDELKSIDFAIDAESIHRVWNNTIETNAELLTQDQVNEFFSALESHFYHIFHIQLSKLELHAIRTPLGIIKRDDSVYTFEAYDSSKLYFVLKYLTQAAQDIIG